MHRGAFCQFPFRWIYYYGSNKSTGKENWQNTPLWLTNSNFQRCKFLVKSLERMFLKFWFVFTLVQPLNLFIFRFRLKWEIPCSFINRLKFLFKSLNVKWINRWLFNSNYHIAIIHAVLTCLFRRKSLISDFGIPSK